MATERKIGGRFEETAKDTTETRYTMKRGNGARTETRQPGSSWPEKEAAAENPDGIWRLYVQRREMEEIFARESNAPITVI